MGGPAILTVLCGIAIGASNHAPHTPITNMDERSFTFTKSASRHSNRTLSIPKLTVPKADIPA